VPVEIRWESQQTLKRGTAALLLVIASRALAGGGARGELIYFRKGGEAQIPAAIEAKRAVVAMPTGNLELAREDIAKFVPGFWPATEWDQRRGKARTLGAEARFAAVWWALENGLTAEVGAEIRELHRLEPKHSPAARMAAILDGLEQPSSDPDFAGFQKALGVGAKIARGPHVLVFHQHSEVEVRERIELLERVIAGYHLLFAAQGIELAVPRRRLVSAWFGDKKDFLAFLHSEEADAFATTRGYYHPTWNAVVAFDARSTPEQKSARGKLAARREELRRFSEQVDGAPARSRIRVKLGEGPMRTVGRVEARALIERMTGEAACEELLLELEWRAIDLGTAAHEMIHQLTGESGLVSGHHAFPHWLHEGLAAQFEVIRGGRWAGISRAHDLRLPDFRGVQSPLPLERLIRDAGFGRGYQRDLYAQAWALVYYLRNQRSGEFVTFVDLLRGPKGLAPATSPGDRVKVAFERAFGSDLDRLEKDWRRFMESVQTPLEQNAPETGKASARSGRSASPKN
jgi:hypothetical protein